MSISPHADFVAFQRSQGLSETTIRNRSSFIRSLETFTGTPSHAVSVAELRAYIGRPGVTASTRRTQRGAFRAYFLFLFEDGYRPDNPGDRLPVIHVPKGEPRPFSAAQIDAMLSTGSYRRTRAMILLGYYQGLRVSSIARVHADDVDIAGGTISVVGKGNKSRLLPLHPVIAELAPSMGAGYWFPARHDGDGHITGHGVSGVITKAIKRAGITDRRLTPHSLRHSFGTDLVDAGVDIRVVQELMMHEQLTTTQIYTRVSEARKREGVEALRARAIPDQSGRGQRAA